MTEQLPAPEGHTMSDENRRPHRHRVIVDCETTGLRLGFDVAVEVSWWHQGTGERATFVPAHDHFDMAHASPEAMEINGYWARGLDNPNRWDDGTEMHRLHRALVDQTFAGSNPHFDVDMLSRPFVALGLDPRPFHHRVDALEGYARGRLGLDVLPGLARVCELLGIAAGDHTSEGDVTAAGRCFDALDAMPRMVLLDPDSADDVEAMARIGLNLPPRAPVRAADRRYGRAVLQKLADRATE